MDAKMRANFLNSIGSGQMVPCPSCGALNKAGSLFCGTCGTKIETAAPAAEEKAPEAPAFNQVKETEAPAAAETTSSAPAFSPVKETEAPVAPEKTASAPAFGTVKEAAPAAFTPVKKEEKKQAFKFVEPEIEIVEEEPSVFAQGLPSWDIVPPQVLVRRKGKR